MITGDAMGRPLVEALDGESGRRDLSSLFLLTSTAAVFSPSVKDDFFRHFPNLIIVDGVGASEVGNNGLLICTKGQTAMIGGGPTFKPGEGTLVLDENGVPVEPGSEAIGTAIRPDTVKRCAAGAGLTRFEVLPIDNELFRFYRLRDER